MCNGCVEIEKSKVEISSVLRLLAVGFVSQEQPAVKVLIGMQEPNDYMDYIITDYGRNLVKIFEGDIRNIYEKQTRKAQAISSTL